MELECPAQSLSYMALLKTEEEQSDSQQMEFRQGLSRSSFSRTFLTMTGESLRTDRQPSLGFSGTRAGKETFPRNQHWLLRSLVRHLGELTGVHMVKPSLFPTRPLMLHPDPLAKSLSTRTTVPGFHVCVTTSRD
mmetsp:Transcript_36885/g.115464  ORF Transcript_36885/g.115464 Transcript_36885/m.115464 type:complete len:135 (-) Transcript_36885:133-537(-)